MNISNLSVQISDEPQRSEYCFQVFIPSILNITSWTLMNQGALVVILDMSLAVISIFFNIMIISSIRDKEEMLDSTFNMVLLNLCSSNLICAVITKSISIVHNGYAVAANVADSEIAFCLIYSFSYRLTWAVLPWTIVLLSWLSFLPRFRRLQENLNPVSSTQNVHTEVSSFTCGRNFSYSKYGLVSANLMSRELKSPCAEESVFQGPTIFDKCIIGSIWFISTIYAVLTDQILSKSVDLPCSVSDQIKTGFGTASIAIAIIIPTIIGPISVSILHVILSITNLIVENKSLPKDTRTEECRNIVCIFLLTTVFLTTYITSMIICELYVPIPGNMLYFILLKYIAGTSHHLFGPLVILISRRDIWDNSIVVYKKGGTTQNTTTEITYEEMQRNLGLGVDCG